MKKWHCEKKPLLKTLRNDYSILVVSDVGFTITTENVRNYGKKFETVFEVAIIHILSPKTTAKLQKWTFLHEKSFNTCKSHARITTFILQMCCLVFFWLKAMWYLFKCLAQYKLIQSIKPLLLIMSCAVHIKESGTFTALTKSFLPHRFIQLCWSTLLLQNYCLEELVTKIPVGWR